MRATSFLVGAVSRFSFGVAVVIPARPAAWVIELASGCEGLTIGITHAPIARVTGLREQEPFSPGLRFYDGLARVVAAGDTPFLNGRERFVGQSVLPGDAQPQRGAAMNHIFEHLAERVAAAAGRPLAFALALTTIVVWGVTGPLFRWSDTWQLVINTGTTIVTFLMVFLIQNAQNRDASAIQAKLDELIRAVGHARNEFIGIEHLSEAELVAIRESLEHGNGDEEARHRAVARLIARR